MISKDFNMILVKKNWKIHEEEISEDEIQREIIMGL